MTVFHRTVIGLVVSGLLWLALPVEAGNAPDWIGGDSAHYPSELFLVGVGYGDNRKAAEDAAYAAIARIFKAEIEARTTEWEKHLQMDVQGQTQVSRQLSVSQATTVSTQKVLENVRIAAVWRDESRKLDYALAVMDRRQAGSVLRERITTLDLEIEELLAQARAAGGKLRKARALHQAVQALLLRDAYNTELRVVNRTGAGSASLTRLASVRQELQDFLSRNFRITVEVSGKHGDRIRTAILEGLGRQGFPAGLEAAPDADVAVVGTVAFEPVDIPQTVFVRWTVSFELRDPSTGRILGTLTRQGREGHLTASEAEARAVRAAQRAVVEELSDRIARVIYGEEEQK